MISGFNLCHLANFTRAELYQLTQVLTPGLTYRVYGGEESRNFQLTNDLIQFLKEVEGAVIYVIVKEKANIAPSYMATLEYAGIRIHGVEYENERYYFDPPTIFKFWDWFRYNFQKPIYYRDLAHQHIADWIQANIGTVINLPIQVNENAGYKAYAEAWLNSGLDFTIDIHVFGQEIDALKKNLDWYKQRKGDRRMVCYEFNGLDNTRNDSILKNTTIHIVQHALLQNLLADYCDEILYFTLAANQEAMNWKWNPPYLHKYFVTSEGVENTISNVWA